MLLNSQHKEECCCFSPRMRHVMTIAPPRSAWISVALKIIMICLQMLWSRPFYAVFSRKKMYLRSGKLGNFCGILTLHHLKLCTINWDIAVWLWVVNKRTVGSDLIVLKACALCYIFSGCHIWGTAITDGAVFPWSSADTDRWLGNVLGNWCWSSWLHSKAENLLFTWTYSNSGSTDEHLYTSR